VGSRYEALKGKLLLERVRADGLVGSAEKHIKRDDIVDWPVGERDGYVFTPANTVVNAFHLRALHLMSELAGALHQERDAAGFAARARATHQVFQRTFFDEARGVYRDGEGTDHASLHANLFPLVFDLVPQDERGRVTRWLASREMACSVYAAQYFMEGLLRNGAGERALALMLAGNDRSWRHMVESGTTISWEAWDQRYKPNQDWNHAWGAAPANLLPRFVLGAQPVTAGWHKVSVRPQPCRLTSAEGRIPTPRGPIELGWRKTDVFRLTMKLPTGVTAEVDLPASETSRGVFVENRPVRARRENGRWVLLEPQNGQVTCEVR
jgi:hypothetical protein